MAAAFWAALMWQVGATARMQEAVAVFRANGFGGLIKTYGWRVVAGFVAFYLIRDVTLYLLLPWLAAKGILSL